MNKYYIILIFIIIIIYIILSLSKLDLILLKISNQVILSSFKCGKNFPYKNVLNSEVSKIYPYYYNLKKFMSFFEILKPALKGLENNVCFLNIDINKCIIINCDWCSLCNGVIETVKQNLISNPELINKIDFKKLLSFDNYFDDVLINRKFKLTNQDIENYCNNTFHKITIDLLLISKIYLKLEQIELRWCPFKRSKESYYRNKDNRFLNPTEKSIYEIGKILANNDTITCNNCPKIINDNWKFGKCNTTQMGLCPLDTTKSIFQPLLEYMINDINNIIHKIYE